MNIHIDAIIGLILSSLIIAYLAEWGKYKKNKNEPLETYNKIAICVFVFWAFAIILDVLFYGGYTFTELKGIKLMISMTRIAPQLTRYCLV